MDPGDDLSDPITLITDPAKSVNNPNNPTSTAGFTFLGQFLDHDMTFDPTSSLARRQDPESIRNFRIPALHLALLRFHNVVAADVAADLGPGFTPEEIFAEAQRIVRWHYQWIVVHEFLPHTIGQAMTDDVLTNGPKFYRWRNDPYIP